MFQSLVPPSLGVEHTHIFIKNATCNIENVEVEEGPLAFRFTSKSSFSISHSQVRSTSGGITSSDILTWSITDTSFTNISSSPSILTTASSNGTISGVTFSSNTVYCGSINMIRTSASVDGSIFHNNKYRSLCSERSNLDIINSTFDYNSGNVLHFVQSNISFHNSSCTNTAGSCVYVGDSKMTISSSSFNNNSNTAVNQENSVSELVIRDTTFIGNGVEGSNGGAVRSSGRSLYVDNCRLIENKGQLGGGIYCMSTSNNYSLLYFTTLIFCFMQYTALVIPLFLAMKQQVTEGLFLFVHCLALYSIQLYP